MGKTYKNNRPGNIVRHAAKKKKIAFLVRFYLKKSIINIYHNNPFDRYSIPDWLWNDFFWKIISFFSQKAYQSRSYANLSGKKRRKK